MDLPGIEGRAVAAPVQVPGVYRLRNLLRGESSRIRRLEDLGHSVVQSGATMTDPAGAWFHRQRTERCVGPLDQLLKGAATVAALVEFSYSFS